MKMTNYFTMVVLAAVVMGISEGQQLALDYYKTSCPNVEDIVRHEMLSIFLTDATVPASLLRLLFHDCQVQGCDASILLDSDDNLNSNSEMISSKNFGIRKREAIERVKSVVEAVCPAQVSCADIIALAARESVAFSGGPQILVPLGRKDSTTCSFQQADAHLPSPTISVDEFLQIFMSKGMTIEESVAILGGHTLGVGHCINIAERLYDPQPRDEMNQAFEALLRLQCPTRFPISNLTFVPNDITPTIFDNRYYRDILEGNGLFSVDSSIATDPRTAPIVYHFSVDQDYFFKVFSSAFVKLSLTNVLTNQSGEVRRICSQVN